MSILKTTSFQILSATMAGQSERTFKVAHRADFDHVERRPGYLYVRSRAISSRINENFDGFDADEIEKGYQTFMGKPVFVSHHNSNHRRARGAIVAVDLHKDHLASGEPDTWVEVLMEVDAIHFPKLAQAIIAGEIARTSMGCDVAYSSCTFCSNKAYTEAEYCRHIPRMKGKRIRRVDAKTGASTMVLVAEQCFGLNFFENSLLVEDPADPTAFVLGIDGLGVTAASKFFGDEGDGPAPSDVDWQDWYTSNPGDIPAAHDMFDRLQAGTFYDDEAKARAELGHHASAFPPGFILTADMPTDDNEPTGADDAINADLLKPHTHGDNSHVLGAVVDKKCPSCGTGYDSHANPKNCPDCGSDIEGHKSPDWHMEMKGSKTAGSKLPRQCGNFTTYTNNTKVHGGACKNCSLPESAHKKTAGNNSDLTGAADKARAIIEKLKPLTEYGPDYNRSVNDHLADARLFLSRGQDEAALRHAYLAETVAGNMAWDDYKAWDNGPTQLAFAGARRQDLIDAHAVGLHDGRDVADCPTCQSNKKQSSFGGKRVASLVRRADQLTQPCQQCGKPVPVNHGGLAVALCPEHRKTAINETIAPPEVDTLRASECPICGSDAYNGEECPVCMFIKPPDMFMDPDLEAAQNADLRQDQSEESLAVGDQVGNDHLQGQTPVGDYLQQGSQEGDLQCDSCGAVQPGSASAGTDPAVAGGAPPATPATPAIPDANAPTAHPTSQPPTQPGAEPPPPVNDESMPLAQGPPEDDDVPPAGKELPKPKDGENDDGQDDGSQAETKPKGDPADKGKVESDVDAGSHDSKDDDGTKPKGQDGSKPPTEDQAVDALQSDLKPGDPCPVCDGKGKLQPKQDDSTDDKKTEDKDAKDDSKDGPPWQKGDNSSKEVKAQSSFNHDTPGVSDMAAPTVKVLASHQAEIRRLKEENAQLRRSVNFIAAAVGITRFADELNPAEPIPQPAGGAPSQTSEEAMNQATRTDVREIGSTPVTDVNADATTTVDQIGGINADTPYSIQTEVTTPVAGTETRIPLDKVRTLPEIQFGDPLVPDTAFPLQGEFAEKAMLGSKGRTYASLRLARLRKAAGIDTTGQEELVLANALDTNASLSDGAIAQEIDVLTQVVTATQGPSTSRQATRRLVPQGQGGVERTIPSVAVGEGLPSFTSASASDDDAFAFCD